MVGITRIRSALSRWTQSYNLRTKIASQTKAMLMMSNEDDHSCNEHTRRRMAKDTASKGKLVKSLQPHNVFAREASASTLEMSANITALHKYGTKNRFS